MIVVIRQASMWLNIYKNIYIYSTDKMKRSGRIDTAIRMHYLDAN